jgi:hypothetical protein
VLDSYLCSFIWIWFAIYSYTHSRHVSSKWWVGHLITKTLRNGPRAHFPFNLPLFGDLCQHIKSNSKCTNITKCDPKCANWSQTKNQLNYHNIWHIWIILPPLSLFSQYKFIFLLLCEKHFVLENQNIFQDRVWSKAKNSPFSHNQISPPQESSFAIRGFWSKDKQNNQKTNTIIFEIHKW